MLQPTQMKYTTTEKELLAIILCLIKYERILYGTKIKVFTYHKNLTFKTLSIKQILCWRTYINQYDVDLCYIPDKDNVLAYCFSQLPGIDSVPSISGRERPPSPQSVMSMNLDCVDVDANYKNWKQKRKEKGTFVDFKKLESPPNEDFNIDEEAFLHSFHKDNKLIKCLFLDSVNPIESLLNLPDRSMLENPPNTNTIACHQERYPELQKLQSFNPVRYPTKETNGQNLIVYQERNKHRWRICLPSSRMNPVVKWYHFTLGHCGAQKLNDTILNQFYYYPKGLSCLCEIFVCPKNYEKSKSKTGKEDGHFPPRHAKVTPWDEV